MQEGRRLAAASPWLQKTTPAFRDALLRKSRLKRLQVGEALYESGSEAGGLSCVLTGRLRVILASNEQGPNFVHLLMPGDWLGYGPLITSGPRLVGHTAVHPTEMLWVDISHAQSILSREPTAWRYFASLALDHLQIALQTIEDLMMRETDQRLAAVLLRLAGCRWEADQPRQATIDVIQADLSAMANIGRTALTKHLADFEKAGLIKLGYRKITVSDAKSLHRLLRRAEESDAIVAAP